MTSTARMARPTWREVVWPKEHGSWSLALEPVALGLLAAPSAGGGALAVAIIAAFFARRPLRIGIHDACAGRRDAARRAAVACGIVATVAWFGALMAAGVAWWPWLLPSAAAGAFFLYFDLRQSSREIHAEVSGAIAFAWLTAVMGAISGRSANVAAALGLVMLARTVPTVLTIRAVLRGRKSGEYRFALPTGASVAGVIIAAMSADVPRTAVVLLAAFAVRAAVWLVYPRPGLRASTVGMIEAALGAAFVLAVGIAWRL